MRRTIMRSLLDKQHKRIGRLARLLRPNGYDEDGSSETAGLDPIPGESADELCEAYAALSNAEGERARRELAATARMLGLLDELLAMQDYTFSQMGTFSQG